MTSARDHFNVIDLRCEGLVNPLGVDRSNPRLSWRMKSNSYGAAQKAYQILCATDQEHLKEGKADLWDSEKIETRQSQHISYAGKKFPRGVKSYWSVRIWNQDNAASEWSLPAHWSYFDLASDLHWQGKWITGNTSSPWLRKNFSLRNPPQQAFVYINAIGYFQFYINGQRVGDDEFSPHIGQYDKRTLCLTYDITQFLKKGSNTLGVWMGSGWNKAGAGVAVEPCLRLQLEALKGGQPEVLISSDETWSFKPSSRSYRGKWVWNQFGGEDVQGHGELSDWADEDFEHSNWNKASLADIPDTPVSSELLPKNKIVETFQPVSVDSLDTGVWLIDMGKAMTGTCEITFPSAPSGHTLTLEFGDDYSADPEHKVGKLNSFNQVSSYTFRGEGEEVFSNRFNYASFRYILITGLPEGKLDPSMVKGFFITMDLPLSSTFECSNETLNGIHHMMEHTLRCLMLGGYQVDCHSRERYGYGGDGQSSLDTTLCLFRSDSLYRKWTQDWLDGQKDSGELTYTSPSSGHGGGPFWCGFLPAATLKHYHHYGDLELIRRNYPSIKKWLAYAQSKVVDGHQEKFCGGWYLGDWASPYLHDGDLKEGDRDKENANVFIQSYMVYVLEQSAQLAEAIGENKDATTFRMWAQERATKAHPADYNPETNSYGRGDQVTFILPLIAGVTPENQTQNVFNTFEETLMNQDGGHLSTGLAGTYLMVQYLQSMGRHDLIYNFTSKTTYPSWGYMLENGATATWEHWEGVRSRIHNCYNNIGSWFIQGLAGIRPDPKDPGFQKALIQPAFLPELDYVKASHDTLFGTISSHWKRVGKQIQFDVSLPANTTATISLPIPSSGIITLDESLSELHLKGIKHETIDGLSLYQVPSGSYRFWIPQS